MIRPINPQDDGSIAAVVRRVMTEFGADPHTTVLGDPSLNTMYANYQEPGAGYFVAELDGNVIGGAGIARLKGADEDICELQRMFLLPSARGHGLGKKLMDICLETAMQLGYKKVYLESLSNMTNALSLYKKTGFREIGIPMGTTGHGGCNVFMIMDLT